jgi:hypothetical protein
MTLGNAQRQKSTKLKLSSLNIYVAIFDGVGRWLLLDGFIRRKR